MILVRQLTPTGRPKASELEPHCLLAKGNGTLRQRGALFLQSPDHYRK